MWFSRYSISKSGIWGRWTSPFCSFSASIPLKYDITNTMLQDIAKMRVQYLMNLLICLEFCRLSEVGMLVDILGKNRLCRLGFNIIVGRITAQQAVMLNKAAEELPSESDITGVDDIEVQEIAEKASGVISQIKDVQTDTEDLFEHPLHELLGLDKLLRSIRGSLKVEVAKKVELEENIAKGHRKLEEFQEYPGEYDDAMKEDITKRIDALNDEQAIRQESIYLLKGRLKNLIMSFGKTIAKVLDKDTSLAAKDPNSF